MAPAAAPTPVPINAPLPAPYPVPAPTAAPAPAPTAAPPSVPQAVAVSEMSARPITADALLFVLVVVMVDLLAGCTTQRPCHEPWPRPSRATPRHADRRIARASSREKILRGGRGKNYFTEALASPPPVGDSFPAAAANS